MKAIVVSQPGDAAVLRYDDAPDPQPGEGELLVRVWATAVNRADVLQRAGAYPPPPGVSPILGLELVGEVVTSAGGWQTGDKVMAVVTGGSYAQLAVVPAGMAVRVPDNLTWEEAAAIPEAFLTAYLNLFTLGQLKPGERVLIHAAASGVGTAAIQLAHAIGAQVVVTAGSAEKLARCVALGADVTINYRTEKFAERVGDATNGAGVDLILDFVGAPYWDDNLAALARGGRIALIGSMGGGRVSFDYGQIMSKNLTITGTTLRRTPLDQKVELTRAFADFALPRFVRGELVPVVDSIFTLEDAAEAHRAMEANRNIGKIVLRVSG